MRKVRRQLNRERIGVARGTVACLMTDPGLAGAVRGTPVKTARSEPAAPCPQDRADRRLQAERPNALRLSDVTYVATRAGFVYVAFVIDAVAPRIVGWRLSNSMEAGFVLDALEHAPCDLRPLQGDSLIHHSDRGVQYVSIKYTERLAEARIESSDDSVGDSYDNALAQSAAGLFKTDVIRPRGPWRRLEAVEVATLEWVDRFNNRRLLEPIGNIPPAQGETRYHALPHEAAIAT